MPAVANCQQFKIGIILHSNDERRELISCWLTLSTHHHPFMHEQNNSNDFQNTSEHECFFFSFWNTNNSTAWELFKQIITVYPAFVYTIARSIQEFKVFYSFFLQPWAMSKNIVEI